jgi:hypothetical protein
MAKDLESEARRAALVEVRRLANAAMSERLLAKLPKPAPAAPKPAPAGADEALAELAALTAPEG